jgi:hypothetical protein
MVRHQNQRLGNGHRDAVCRFEPGESEVLQAPGSQEKAKIMGPAPANKENAENMLKP